MHTLRWRLPFCVLSHSPDNSPLFLSYLRISQRHCSLLLFSTPVRRLKNKNVYISIAQSTNSGHLTSILHSILVWVPYSNGINCPHHVLHSCRPCPLRPSQGDTAGPAGMSLAASNLSSITHSSCDLGRLCPRCSALASCPWGLGQKA